MTRNGKIARLPLALREEINQRLLDAHTTASILDWLNQQPEARSVMAEHFKGTVIDRHNLGEWRLGGYREWLQERKSAAMVRSILDEARALDEVTHEKSRLTEAMQTLLTAELAATIRLCLAQKQDPEARWERLKELLKQVDRVRRTNVWVSREKREQDKWDWEEGDIMEKLDKQGQEAVRVKTLARFQAEREVPVRAAMYGGTEADWHRAHCVTALKLGLEFPPKKPGKTWKPEAVKGSAEGRIENAEWREKAESRIKNPEPRIQERGNAETRIKNEESEKESVRRSQNIGNTSGSIHG